MFNSLFSTHVNKTHVFSVGAGVKPVQKPNATNNAEKPKKEESNVQD